jgi:hypothetical protein
MTVPAGRVTQESNPDVWQGLYNQWLEERKPGWVTRRSGADSWLVVQLVDGSIAFDPQTNKNLYEDTSF